MTKNLEQIKFALQKLLGERLEWYGFSSEPRDDTFAKPTDFGSQRFRVTLSSGVKGGFVSHIYLQTRSDKVQELVKRTSKPKQFKTDQLRAAFEKLQVDYPTPHYQDKRRISQSVT